jgi:putative acetyltransferase
MSLLFLVRNATNRDTEGLTSTIKEVYDEYSFPWFPDGYHADLYDVEQHYWRNGHGFWVAETLEDEPRIVGTCALHMFDSLPLGSPVVEVDGQARAAGADCSLERLYVRAEGRGQGVGATLFQHAIYAALDHGKRRMEIWSDKRFEAAHRLYEKFGAVQIGERLCHDPDQSPEYGLILDLRKAKL